MGYQALTQLVLVIISIVIIVTFLEPKFQDIRATQDETAQYQQAVDNAAKFNAKLDALLAEIDNLDRSDVVRLERFLPSTIESAAVGRDLQTMVEGSGMRLKNIAYAAMEEPAPAAVAAETVSNDAVAGSGSDELAELVQQTFTVSALGTYDQIKELLLKIERNAYPLEVETLALSTPNESELALQLGLSNPADLLLVDLELTTFALPSNL